MRRLRPLPLPTMERPLLPGSRARSTAHALSLAVLAVLQAVSAPRTTAAAPPAARAPEANAPRQALTIPPLPDGTPEELVAFAKGLRNPPNQPRSREEMMAYMDGMARVSLQAAEKALVKCRPGDAVHDDASRLKLESLMMLERMGDEQASTALAAYAADVAKSSSPELAREGQRLLIVAEAQRLFEARDVAAGPELVRKVAAMLAAAPDDVRTASLAAQLAAAFGDMPDAGPLAVAAAEAFVPLLVKSPNPQVQELGANLAGTARRLSLPGKPMEIRGRLLDGTPFDPASLAGKVVLVDFWATWCGPCVAEIPNVLEQYRKYRDKGFEVVGISLDEDREALAAFVAEKKVPWPIILDAAADGPQRMAAHYGITGIPQLILIGRDGRVITLEARGKQLEERLAELFPDGR